MKKVECKLAADLRTGRVKTSGESGRVGRSNFRPSNIISKNSGRVEPRARRVGSGRAIKSAPEQNSFFLTLSGKILNVVFSIIIIHK